MLHQQKEIFQLSLSNIDKISKAYADALTEAEVNKKDILRLRLSIEEILFVWLEQLGEVMCCFETGKRFGRQFIDVSVEGRRSDPKYNDSNSQFFITGRLLANADLSLQYTYKNGANYLTLNPPRKIRIGQPTQVLISIVLAVLCVLAVKALPDIVQDTALSLTKPLFTVLVDVLSAVASPLIFLSICWSIISIGDISLVSKIGKLMIGRMIIGTFVVCAFFTALYGSFFITFDKGTGFSAAGLSDIYKLILAIVPPDIVTPFQTGNALQIIFLGVVSGVAMLILGDRVSGVKNDVEQLNSIVQYLMSLISRLIPLFTFLSTFNLLLNKQGNIVDLVDILLLGLSGSYLLISVYILIVSVSLKVGVISLIKKLWPSHIIALTTASSIATLPVSIDACENKLGIPSRVANFIIPFGTVIFKLGGLIRYVAVILPITQMMNINVSPVWLVSAVVTISLCSIATPPIVGGALSTLTVLFIQLGIPQEALGIAIAANSFLDITSCGCNVTCLQLEAVLGTNSLGMLDKNILRKAA